VVANRRITSFSGATESTLTWISSLPSTIVITNPSGYRTAKSITTNLEISVTLTRQADGSMKVSAYTLRTGFDTH
jgi:hypothetical protein